MRIGYLGPAGTFSDEALRGRAGGRPARRVERVPLPDDPRRGRWRSRDGDVDRALVPIENSLEGAVNATLDALVADARGVRIVGETVLPIRTCLVARGRHRARRTSRVVVSHPQAARRSARRFLRRELPARRRCAPPPRPPRRCARSSRPTTPWAALGPRAAGRALRRRRPAPRASTTTPTTRRASCGWRRAGAPPAAPRRDGPWKTSVVFSGAGDGAPGWLVRCLSEFAFRGVNLARIESRPRRPGLGHYIFLVDLEGRADERGRRPTRVAALRAHCEDVRLLGSYPAAS